MADLRITKFSVNIVNLGTIIDVQSWCRTCHTMDTIIQNILRKHKGACKSSWSRIGSLKSFTLTIPWNLAKLVKIFLGIIVRQHHTDWKETNGIAERAVRRIKEGTSAVLLQSGLDEKWWADSMECHCYLRNIQDLLSDGKTPYERRFGEPLKGAIIPFGAMLEYHPISAKKTYRDCINSVLKSCQVYSLDMRCTRCGIWRGDIMFADIEELEEMDASELHARRL